MKGVIITLVVLSVLLTAPSAFSATSSGSFSGSIVGQYYNIGIGPGETISLTKDPIIKKRTVRLFGMTITYINTTVYWTNGKLSSKSSVIEIRDSKGRLTFSTGISYRYDWSGKLISPISRFTHSLAYGRNGALSGEIYYTYSYDTRHKLLSYNKSVISYTYTAKGELKTRTNSAYFYDGRGKKVSSSVNTMSYSYNDDGTLKQEVYVYESRGADNAIWAYSRSVTDYYHLASGDTYNIISVYDINGNLCAKSAEINIYADDQSVTYRVLYDIDASGNIQYTHVYDANNIEINTLSGIGYKEPTTIISDIRNPDESSPFIMHVDGDLTLNSNKTWDLNKITVEVSGNLNFGTNTNGYDIYSEGNMTLTGDKIDLSAYSLYVNGNLAVNGTLSVGSIYVTGDITINAGGFNLVQNGNLPVNGGSFIFGDTLPVNGGSITINGTTTVSNNLTFTQRTITLQGDTELIDKMSVGNTIQTQKQQVPRGVSVSGTISIKGQEVPSLKK